MITSTTSHYKSSTIDSATYNVADKTLTIYFKWATYVYEAVDQDTWNKFNSADSQGKALNEFIIYSLVHVASYSITLMKHISI